MFWFTHALGNDQIRVINILLTFSFSHFCMMGAFKLLPCSSFEIHSTSLLTIFPAMPQNSRVHFSHLNLTLCM